MAQFEIIPSNNGKIRCKKNKQVVLWSVFSVNELTHRRIFLRSFYTKHRAEEFIKQLERDIEEGNYESFKL